MRVMRASRINGEFYHLKGMLASVRDRMLSAMPAERIMARYDWLYGWKPPTT